MPSEAHKWHRERVRKEFLENGFSDSTPPHKMLEMLLFYCLPQGDTNPLAHELINHFGSISAVLDAPVDELIKFKGLTERNAVLFKLIMPIARAYRISEQNHTIGFKSLDDVGRFLLDRYLGETKERISAIYLDGSANLLDFHFISDGDISSVNLSMRILMERALKCRSTGIIIAHNHPSGLAVPSDEDIASTKIISEMFSGVGIKLIDHIVIAHDDYVSMASSSRFADIFKKKSS